MINLNDLRLFAHVVEHRGFATAARALALPKSTLSKRVAALEHSLGVRLLQRTSRSFAVTETGEDIYRHAQALAVEAEAVEQVVQGRLAEPSGLVRITASVITAQSLLADLLPRLAMDLPRVQLALHATDRFVDVVQEGFDLALRDHFGPLPDSGLVQRRLRNDPVILVADPGYLQARGQPASPHDLSAHDGLLTSALGRPTWTLQDASGAVVEVQPLPRARCDEPVTLLRLAQAGLGIVPLPRGLCLAAMQAGALAQVLPGWTAGAVTTTLLMPHRRGQLPSVGAVAQAVAAAVAMREA